MQLWCFVMSQGSIYCSLASKWNADTSSRMNFEQSFIICSDSITFQNTKTFLRHRSVIVYKADVSHLSGIQLRCISHDESWSDRFFFFQINRLTCPLHHGRQCLFSSRLWWRTVFLSFYTQPAGPTQKTFTTNQPRTNTRKSCDPAWQA